MGNVRIEYNVVIEKTYDKINHEFYIREVSSSTSIDNKYHGRSHWWYSDGQIYEVIDWLHGLRHGLIQRWTCNGYTVLKFHYRHDTKHGLCFEIPISHLNAQGEFTNKTIYKNKQYYRYYINGKNMTYIIVELGMDILNLTNFDIAILQMHT